MYGLLATIVITAGVVYLLGHGKATFTIRVVHTVDESNIPEPIIDEADQENTDTLDNALKAVQSAINIVNGGTSSHEN